MKTYKILGDTEVSELVECIVFVVTKVHFHLYANLY